MAKNKECTSKRKQCDAALYPEEYDAVMTMNQPSLLAAPPARPPLTPVSPRPSGTCRYNTDRTSRKVVVFAAAFSASLHLGVLFGIGHVKKKIAPPVDDHVIALNLEFQEIKELDEPEPEVVDDPGEKPDLGALVPMQADVPQIPQPSDFVQQVDFASLVEQPDLNATKLLAIPEHISHGSKIGNGLGIVFNISDLDRIPTAVFQPAPIPPKSVKIEEERVTVRVEFIVTADGRVVNVFAVGSTDTRFNDAAVFGVGKWKFKPGIKGGRKVNTRMLVPIIFKPSAQDT